MTTQTPDLIAAAFTADQLRVIHAALLTGADKAREKQLHYLELHESPKVGPVASGEAWQAFKLWENRENEVCRAIGVIQATAREAGVEFGLRDYGI